MTPPLPPAPPVLAAAAPSDSEEVQRILPLPGHPSLLVVSELIGDAILHALPPASLRLTRRRTPSGGTLRIEVTDGGPRSGLPTKSPVAPDEHGRGLMIVRALSTGHGTRTEQDGSATWWAELTTS